MALLAAEPAFAQEWMERFLQDQKTPKAAPQGQTQNRNRGQEGRRADDSDSRSRTAIPPEATSLSDVPAAEPEVRRALPADSSFLEVEAPPAAPSTEPPTPPAVPFDETLPVRRAEPVERAMPLPPPLESLEETPPAVPRPTPRIARPAPVATPAEEIPAAIPAEPAPPPVQAEAAPPAEAPPAAPQVTAEERLDPRAHEIRLSPGVASAPADVVQFLYANNLYAKKEYQRAALEFERYLTLYPGGADRQAAYFRMAESYRQTGSLNAARKSYETLIYTFQMGDFIGPASYRLAEICYQDKDYSAAVTFFRKASVWVKDPAIIVSAKFYAARSLENLKFTSEAIQAYEDVLAIRENNPFREASQLSLVALLSDSGRKSQALLLLNTLRDETDKPPVKAEATVRIGLLLLEQKQNAKAVAELKAALKMPDLGSWKEVAELGLLRVLYNDGQFQQVLDIYKVSGKEFSPEAVPEVLLVLANSNRQLGKLEEARALYEQIARDYPDTPYAGEAEYERLVALYNSNAPELIPAIDAYLASRPEANAKRDQLTLMKAESYYKAKNYAAAAPVYASLESSTLTGALKAEAAFKLGWCYAQTGDHAGAIAAFSSFLSKNPANKLAPTALAQRGFGYERSKNYKAALNDFNEVLRRYPRAKEREFVMQRKALILGQQDESKAMVDTFTLLLKEFPQSQAAGQANYWIGLTAFQARNYKAAIPSLVAARKLDNDFAEKATILILEANRNLEDRNALAAEVDGAGPAIKIQPEILRWLGGEFLKAGEPLRAEKYLLKLTALDGTGGTDAAVAASDWLNLGQAQTKLKKWADAEKSIQTYLDKVTDPIPQASGYLALSQAQLGAGQYDGAQQSANRTLEMQPEGRLNALGRMVSGDIAMARQNFESAAKLFLSIAVVYDDPVITPQALEKAYHAYRQAGDEKQAAKVLNDLQTKFPEYKLNVDKLNPSATAKRP